MKPKRALEVIHNKRTDGYECKIAFATSDRHRVDQHFGSAESFSVYGKHKDQWHLVRFIEFPESPEGHDTSKLDHRVQAIYDCDFLYCVEVGASAIHRLLQKKVQPLKVPAGAEIKSLLSHHTSQTHITTKNPTAVDDQEKRLRSLLEEHWQ